MSPDDLDTERPPRGSRSAGSRLCVSGAGVEVLPFTGRDVTAVFEPQFQGAGVFELSSGVAPVK